MTKDEVTKACSRDGARDTRASGLASRRAVILCSTRDCIHAVIFFFYSLRCCARPIRVVRAQGGGEEKPTVPDRRVATTSWFLNLVASDT